MWEFHVDDSAKIMYNIILGRYPLTVLVLNLKFSRNIIKVSDEPFEGSTEPMIYLCTYAFKYLNTGKISLEEYFG